MQGTRRRTRAWPASGGGTGWIAAALWSFALLAVPVQGDSQSRLDAPTDLSDATDSAVPAKPDGDEATAGVSNVGKRAQSDDTVEEVIVTGEKIEQLTVAERRKIYQQLSRGRSLYSKNEYKRAFPLLLNTAEHGFKDAQVRVGYIYLQGLGEVTRDSSTAIGWLGVAASGNSAPGIQNYFNDIWSRIPEQYVPYFEEVVEEYESRYGEEATGVTCDMRRPAGSHLKQLSCFFERDLTLEETRLLDEMFREVIETRVPTIFNRPEQPLPPVDDSD